MYTLNKSRAKMLLKFVVKNVCKSRFKGVLTVGIVVRHDVSPLFRGGLGLYLSARRKEVI